MRLPAPARDLMPLLTACLLGCPLSPHSSKTAAGAEARQPQPSSAAAASAEPAAATATATATVAIPNARQALPGVVTGGVPSDENLRAAAAQGYKTVVSLLPPAEAGDEAARAEQLGLDFVSIPIAGPADLTVANAERLGAILGTPSRRPLILHCTSGNRAGALLALEAFYVEHQPAQAAVELGVRAGMTKLRDTVAAQLEQAGAPPAAP